jgi:hypothetical protein
MTAACLLIRDHHSGYVSGEQYERYQAMLAANAYMKFDGSVKSGRGGGALLSGLLRCRRCGRMIHLNYSGSAPHKVPRYDCNEIAHCAISSWAGHPVSRSAATAASGMQRKTAG